MEVINQPTSTPQTPTPLNSPIEKSHGSRIMIPSIIVAILLILVGAGSYILATKKSQPPVQKVAIQPSPTPVDETANWITYVNPTFRYTLKYPNWLAITEEGKYSVDGVFISIPKTTSFSIGKKNYTNQQTIKEGFQLTITVDENKNSYNLEQLKNNIEFLNPAQKDKPIDILIVDGQKAYGSNVGSARGMYRLITISNGSIYTFNFETDITSVGKILLSTFQFTN